MIRALLAEVDHLTGELAAMTAARAEGILDYRKSMDPVPAVTHNHAIEVANANWRRAEAAEARVRELEAQLGRANPARCQARYEEAGS